LVENPKVRKSRNGGKYDGKEERKEKPRKESQIV